ncbi:MAG: acyl-CoA thioesterase [Flavobacteriaceae bacterium]
MTNDELPRSSRIRIAEDWIDYNGHLNTAWYHRLLDQGADEILEEIDLGPREIAERNKTIFTVEFHIHHQREVFVGSEVYSTLRIIDFDDKRMHYVQELRHADEDWVSAVGQTLVLHIDLARRKVEPWPDDIREKIVAMHARHAKLPPHPLVGAVLSVHKK